MQRVPQIRRQYLWQHSFLAYFINILQFFRWWCGIEAISEISGEMELIFVEWFQCYMMQGKRCDYQMHPVSHYLDDEPYFRYFRAMISETGICLCHHGIN